MILYVAVLLLILRWNLSHHFLLKMFTKIRFILKIKFGHISVTFFNKEPREGGGLTVRLLKLGHLKEVVVAL